MMKDKIIKVSVALLIFVATIYILVFSPVFSVDNVVVRGLERIETGEIEKNASIHNKNIFFVSEKSILEELSSLSYFKSAVITKEYPETVYVDVIERLPSACVKYTESSYFVIDSEGYVLEMVSEPSYNCPVFTGIEFKDFTVGKKLETAKEETFSIISTLASLVEKYEMSSIVSRIDVEDLKDVHMYVYNIDFILGNPYDSEIKIRKAKACFAEISGYKDRKIKVDLEKDIVEFIY